MLQIFTSIFSLFLCAQAFAQTSNTSPLTLPMAAASQSPEAPSEKSEWQWLKGTEATSLLLQKNWQMENGVEGLIVQNQPLYLTSYWIFVGEDQQAEPPKFARIRMGPKADAKNNSTGSSTEFHFQFGFKFKDIQVPMLTLKGTLRGVSYRPSTGDIYVYFYLSDVYTEPLQNLGTLKETIVLNCAICSSTQPYVDASAMQLAPFKGNTDQVISIHLPPKLDRLSIKSVKK